MYHRWGRQEGESQGHGACQAGPRIYSATINWYMDRKNEIDTDQDVGRYSLKKKAHISEKRYVVCGQNYFFLLILLMG